MYQIGVVCGDPSLRSVEKAAKCFPLTKSRPSFESCFTNPHPITKLTTARRLSSQLLRVRREHLPVCAARRVADAAEVGRELHTLLLVLDLLLYRHYLLPNHRVGGRVAREDPLVGREELIVDV